MGTLLNNKNIMIIITEMKKMALKLLYIKLD